MPSIREQNNEKMSNKRSTLCGNETYSSDGDIYSMSNHYVINMGNSTLPVDAYCLSKYYDVVRRLIKIMVSPESAGGILDGILSVPVDIFYLGRAFLDTENRYRNEIEHYRLATLIKREISDEDTFTRLINLIFYELFSHVPEKTQNKIFSHIGGAIFGRTIANAFVSGEIAKATMKKAISSISSAQLSKIVSISASISGAMIGNILLTGGMAERAIYTSRALKEDCPEIYNRLRPTDLDLLYFLVESIMEPVVDAIKIRRNDGQIAFEKMMELMANEIRK
ncbi:hypothetical protein EWJ91_24190 [Salmonella enterica subsp. enterica serovar Ouagadougou]|uniref:Uncharacterized protein n=1 Tax=Salmonella enterica subsp. enterica serovar Ouagadougou TaxID=2564899 RepID=A0A5I0D801_SALET|nr:hypothetical protein [Salmonella enterica subsp. enterica serovar Ouagadougou]EEA4939857.1 hypothetical protein [Salmonella enterica subsp. enterica serovar Enteritidis]EBR9514460.1 hypothetical protein [Salmonella enterica subsp. enterica serovar Ouagadougou]EBV0638067.1 hypothetical protein [Salmonella enterica subsp. enterica serovar Ouagadougou]EBV0756744.1 hypothetical protein [Salmonella enterica subsp. enterica serovar Ouagadougou]